MFVSGKSHAMHCMSRKSSLWEKWVAQMASECTIRPMLSGCTSFTKMGWLCSALTDTTGRLQNYYIYITSNLSFGFQVGSSCIAQHQSNNIAHIGYTQHVPNMPYSLPRCSAVKLHLCLFSTSRRQPDWWEWLYWTSDHMLYQAVLMQGKGGEGTAISCSPINLFLYSAGKQTWHETGADDDF